MGEDDGAILSRLNDLFRDVFLRDSIVLTRATTAKDVDGWDSLAHVTLMLSVQQWFGVRLSASESSRLKDVGTLIDLISAKRRARIAS